MHDDKDNLTPDDEYQFPEDEFIQGESTSGPSVEAQEALEQEAKMAKNEKLMQVYEKIRELLANRVIASIIAVIILLLCAHWFFSGSNKKTAITAQPVVQTQATTTKQQPSAVVLNQLSGIKQSADSMENSVTSLKSDIQLLQTSVAQNAQSHQQVESTLVQLSSRINDLQAEQKQLANKMQTAPAAKKKSATAAFTLPPVYFYTRAVVHNRAWIIGTNGQNISITNGDKVPEYGKIVSINANTGVIETSSGKEIQFPPSDH